MLSARDQGRHKGRDSAMSMAAMSSERIEPDENVWTRRLALFLRIMALISIAQGPVPLGAGDRLHWR